MRDDLSPKQAKTLDFIVEYIKKNSFPPTYKEIARSQRIDIKSVAQRLEQLRKKGYIEVRKNIPRGIVLTPKAGVEFSKVLHVNIYCKIAKLKKHFKLEEPERSVSVSLNLFGVKESEEKRFFLFRITNMSEVQNYLDVQVFENDIIAVVRGSRFLEGDKVMSIYEGKIVMGKVEKVEKFFTIRAGKGLIPIGGSNAMVVGRVVGIIRRV